ncbi:hypothetical protein LZ009_09515 [Ramlibacter sp. XY19]|uniref:hypothetical protein n=1 Tax=Ramlibacter paludis TaxID=2908000 RepID=UPI0023DCBBE5|nr:hypothetical protein [Ramlibacter paludis]MCG2593018.1 hypothetical protein [Ramlibacter paludis]
MYQLEVKRWLVYHRFSPQQGWRVYVDVDPMERGASGHAADKVARAREAETALVTMGAQIRAHKDFGRVDLVAEHDVHGRVFVEVEGSSGKQREQALYSALGQILLSMSASEGRYVLAVPDDARWERQLAKIPSRVRELLKLECVLVSDVAVRDV